MDDQLQQIKSLMKAIDKKNERIKELKILVIMLCTTIIAGILILQTAVPEFKNIEFYKVETLNNNAVVVSYTMCAAYPFRGFVCKDSFSRVVVK